MSKGLAQGPYAIARGGVRTRDLSIHDQRRYLVATAPHYIHVYACMYVYIYVCMYIILYTCMYRKVLLDGPVFSLPWSNIAVGMYMYVCMYECTYTLYLCLHTCMCTCMYVCMHTCMHAYNVSVHIYA